MYKFITLLSVIQALVYHQLTDNNRGRTVKVKDTEMHLSRHWKGETLAHTYLVNCILGLGISCWSCSSHESDAAWDGGKGRCQSPSERGPWRGFHRERHWDWTRRCPTPKTGHFLWASSEETRRGQLLALCQEARLGAGKVKTMRSDKFKLLLQ